MSSQSKIPVLYISYDGLTDPLGQSQIMPYIKGLSKLNFQFTLVSFEKKNNFLKYKNEVTEWSRINNVDWKAHAYHKKPPVLSTLYDLLILWNSCVKLHRKKKFKIVHCRSYLTSLIGLRIKKKYGLKFIFDMRGFWADERVEGGLWNLKNPVYKWVYKYFKKKEVDFLIEADTTISLTENAKKEILSWEINPAPITVIPTCVDLTLFDPATINEIEKEKLRYQLGIKPDDFILLYLGSWGTWYLTDEMMRFYRELKKSKLSLKFLILTTDNVELKGFTDRQEIIVSQCTREKVPLNISIADLAVCFIKPSFSKKASSATKIGEIMAMNVPVITNANWGDVDEVAKGGHIHIYDSSQPLQSILTSIEQELNLRAFCKVNMSLEIGVERYSQTYSS